MTAAADTRGSTQIASPYRGLMPYTEEDAAVFCGRDADVQLITDNARASRVAVLFGPSGVGKSSVLQAGVVRKIRDENSLRVERSRAVDFVAAYLKDWRDDPFAAVRAGCRDAYSTVPRAERLVDQDGQHAGEELFGFRRPAGVHLLLILDQFEEFFLYHQHDSLSFAEFLAGLTERGNRIHVLISIREDALARLGDFEAEIDEVLDNRLRLDHLDRKSAEAAIRKPLERYNASRPSDQAVDIEVELVEELLRQVQIGRVQVDSTQEAASPGLVAPAESPELVRIEAPFLQLVLTRLWDEEMSQGSGMLRLSTLRKLGGAQSIVRQHLDRVMRGFSPPELEVLADAFGQLVTPSGSKIAHRPSDLAVLSKRDPQQMRALLRRLAEGRQLILREVPAPMDEPGAESRYEIFHDVLALAVLDWRRRFLVEADARRQQAELVAQNEKSEKAAKEARIRLRKARGLIAAMALLLVACLVMAGVAVVLQRKASASEDKAKTNETKAKTNETKAVDAQARQKLESVLTQVNAELRSDPSAALRHALPLVFDDAHDKDGRYQDAFRQALDAADTDVVIDLSSPGEEPPAVILASFVGDSGIVAVTKEGRVLVWDVVGHDPVRIADEPRVDLNVTGQVTAAEPAVDGSYVVVQTSTEITAVDLATGEDTTFEGMSDVETMAVADSGSHDQVLLYDYAGHVAVWDVAHDSTTTLKGLGSSTGVAAIDTTGDYVAVVEWTAPYHVSVLSLATGKQVASTPLESNLDASPDVFDADLAFTSKGSQEVEGDPVLVVMPTATTTEAFVWDVLHDGGQGPTPLGDSSSQWRVLYDTADLATESGVNAEASGRIAIAGDKTVSVFNQSDGTLRSQTFAGGDFKTAVEAYPPDRSVFAVAANEGYVELYRSNIDPPTPMWTFRGHQGPIDDLAFSNDGKSLITAGADGTVRVWRLPDQVSFDWYIPDWILAARYTPDGRYVFAFSPKYGYVTREDRSGRIKSKVPPGLLGMAVGMDPAPDGQRAAVLDYFCDVPLVVAMTKKATAKDLVTPKAGICSNAVAWNPDPGAHQIVAGGYDGTLVAWDADTGEVIRTTTVGDGEPVVGLAFSGDGQTLVAATGTGKKGRIWRMNASDLSRVSDWASPDIRWLAASFDGSYVAVDGENHHVVRVYDAEHPDAEPLELTQATGTLGAVTLSPDAEASRVAVTTSEGMVYVWDRPSGRLLAVMRRHSDAANEATFDPEDIDHMYSGGDDGFMVGYTCDLCSTSADELKDTAQDLMAQEVGLSD